MLNKDIVILLVEHGFALSDAHIWSAFITVNVWWWQLALLDAHPRLTKIDPVSLPDVHEWASSRAKMENFKHQFS